MPCFQSGGHHDRPRRKDFHVRAGAIRHVLWHRERGKPYGLAQCFIALLNTRLVERVGHVMGPASQPSSRAGGEQQVAFNQEKLQAAGPAKTPLAKCGGVH